MMLNYVPQRLTVWLLDDLMGQKFGLPVCTGSSSTVSFPTWLLSKDLL